MQKKELLKSIPAVNDFLAAPEAEEIIDEYSRDKFLQLLRKELDNIRSEILSSDFEVDNFNLNHLNVKYIINNIEKKLKIKSEAGLKKVINASGVIVHTNLGRSNLAAEALKKVLEIAENYSTLEFDLEKGERGYRYNKVKELLKDLTGAESAVVVNNNAAAVMLVLTALVQRKEVIIARGEMVEIGGSFRIPEVMENSGAVLQEVGSTNRVYSADYINAINENTGALIKVHTSNYRVQGFTHTVSSKELAETAHSHQLPLIEDLGSGILFDLSDYGLPYEPTVKEEIEAGIDVLTFSGDKLLGGPQAGIIAGKEQYISQIETHPLMRALRVDKMTLAALEETLKLYYDFEKAVKRIPTLNLITESSEVVKKRALKLESKINKKDAFKVELIKTAAKIGGGAYPLNKFDSYGLKLSLEQKSTEAFISELRKFETPVIARIQADKAIFDLKTVKDEEIELLADSINQVLAEVF
jgi:L-seryl-tRNA(Ser) seleniumtransferase